MYLIPAHTSLAFGTPDHVAIRWLHCLSPVAGGIDLFSLHPCRYELAPWDPARFAMQMGRLEELRRKGKGELAWGEELEKRGILLELLGAFDSGVDAAGDGGARLDKVRRLAPALQQVDTHPDGDLSIPALAALVHLTPTSFTRMFSATLGMPPVRYVLQKKVDAARPLLRDTSRTLEDIARELGFADAFHLSKMFKKLTGLSPREFRNRKTGGP